MLRLIVISAALLAACESKPAKPGAPAGSATPSAGSAAATPPPPAAKPATTLAQVEAWAPKGTQVAAADLTVPGVDLFAVTLAKPSDEDFPAGAIVGVVGGPGGKLVEGRDLIRAVAAAKPDAATFARVAMWIAQEDGDLLTKATTPEQKKAKVAAPAIKGEQLTFWVWTTGEPRFLERGIASFTTGAVELGPVAAKPETLISNAIKILLGDGVRRHARAAELLAASCTNPRARQSLLAALSSHPRDRTRAAVTDVIHKCGPVTVDPLVYSMENDKAALVRTRAASALGRVGDPRARPALARAARSDDANLVWAAKNSLGKIK